MEFRYFHPMLFSHPTFHPVNFVRHSYSDICVLNSKFKLPTMMIVKYFPFPSKISTQIANYSMLQMYLNVVYAMELFERGLEYDSNAKRDPLRVNNMFREFMWSWLYMYFELFYIIHHHSIFHGLLEALIGNSPRHFRNECTRRKNLKEVSSKV